MRFQIADPKIISHRKQQSKGLFLWNRCLCPDASWGPLISHHDHLKALDTVSELAVLAGETLVLLLEVSDVLGGFAEDSGLVELVGWGKSAEILVALLFHVLNAGLLESVDHDAKRRDRISESGDLVVEVGAVALLDHVVRGLLGGRAVAASRGRG